VIEDASTIMVWLVALGGTSGVSLVIRQIRIGLRDRGDRNLLRHIYDQDRQADVLTTLESLRRAEPRFTKPASDDQETGGNQAEPPDHPTSLTTR
jgi:hypothetical protein